jgi:hypothetical protein
VVAARAGNRTLAADVISKAAGKKQGAVTRVKEAGSPVAARLVDRDVESRHEYSSQTGPGARELGLKKDDTAKWFGIELKLEWKEVMEQIQKADQCQYPGCKCSRPAAGDYCGDVCANAQESGMDNECKCGHPECL